MQDFPDSDVAYERLLPEGDPEEHHGQPLPRVTDVLVDVDDYALDTNISEVPQDSLENGYDSLRDSRSAASIRRTLRSWQLIADLHRRFRVACSRYIPAVGAIIILNATCVTAVWCKALWVSVVNLYRGPEPCDQPVLTYFMLVDLIMNVAPPLIFGATSSTTLRLLWGGPSIWAMAGLGMVRASSTCSETSPSMFDAVSLYVYMATTTYLLIFTISLCYLGDMPGDVISKFKAQSSEIAWELPIVKAGSKELINQESGEFLECLICLADFGGDEEAIVRTSCGHYWHRKCLATWCKTRETCPHCRAALIGPNPQG